MLIHANLFRDKKKGIIHTRESLMKLDMIKELQEGKQKQISDWCKDGQSKSNIPRNQRRLMVQLL